MLKFLTNRVHILELVEGSRNKQNHTTAFKKASKKVNVAVILQSQCVYCEGSHHVSRCEKFQKLLEKREEVKKRQLCFKFLRKGHYI